MRYFLMSVIGLMAGLPQLTLHAAGPCRIEVVEQGTGWPVPLVELRTIHNVRFVTDNAGVIACDLPELMGRETWFSVAGHGYEVPADGFGYRGVRIPIDPGATRRIEVRRTIIARRIGRLTGGGLFAESQKCGDAGLPESGVLGCDSTQNAIHRGKLFWIWGDTNLPRYPLGIFDASCAVSEIPPADALVPPLKPKFDYFRDEKGQPRGVAKLPGPGPTWLAAMVSLPDRSGNSHLVATYLKVKPPLDAYQWGLTHWNEEKQAFEPFRVLWEKDKDGGEPPPRPDGHAVPWEDEAGRKWILFGNPFPTLKIPATFEAWQDAGTWIVLKPQESVPDRAGGPAVKPHTGSIAWNPHRRRWVTVFLQNFGKPSVFGELWYAEADQPTGPWGPAVKVLSHANYTFYNPVLHPEFTGADSPSLYFEGTYTVSFTDNQQPTPRYEYNQMLYRLDLDDPALKPSQPR